MRARRIPVLLAAAWVLHLGACSVRLTSPESFPEAEVLHDVVPYDQEPLLCGPYALAAVLGYLGKEADPKEIAGEIFSPGAGGTLTMDLYLEARRRGAGAREMRGTGTDLFRELEAGFPVIVLFRYPGLKKSPGHFVAVTGYSSSPAGFFLLWGDGKVSWMRGEQFDELWTGSGSWALAFSGEDVLDR